MRVIVSGTYYQAACYGSLRGWSRHSTKIVTEPYQLQGLGQGVEIFMLGPRQAYEWYRYPQFLEMLGEMKKSGRATVTYDDLDNWL